MRRHPLGPDDERAIIQTGPDRWENDPGRPIEVQIASGWECEPEAFSVLEIDRIIAALKEAADELREAR